MIIFQTSKHSDEKFLPAGGKQLRRPCTARNSSGILSRGYPPPSAWQGLHENRNPPDETVRRISLLWKHTTNKSEFPPTRIICLMDFYSRESSQHTSSMMLKGMRYGVPWDNSNTSTTSVILRFTCSASLMIPFAVRTGTSPVFSSAK